MLSKNLIIDTMNLFFIMLLDATTEKGTTAKAPIIDPKKDIFIVSKSGFHILFMYSKFGGNICFIISKKFPPRLINVLKLNPVIPIDTITAIIKIKIKSGTIDLFSTTCLPFPSSITLGLNILS
ncbi:hypothetical protein RATSFB_0541 [Candidatus Arthromitus sp. SFB-rat-Yit]|nr:hypothetical protein RATSFB_0541 [Candidatus Arthromitus sp. SFB-rat-Yit]